MNILEIERVNVTNEVIEYIKKNIIDGKWTVGEKILSENQLSEKLGVSRASVRTAIRHFVGLDVLESIQGKGTYLISNDINKLNNTSENTLSRDDYLNMEIVLQFRWALEPSAAYLAVDKIDKQGIILLKETFRKMQKNIGNRDEFVKADMKFHQILCEYSKNPFIINSLNILYNNNYVEFTKFNDKFGYKDGIYYHSLIISAIESKNRELVKSYVEEHLHQALDRLSI